MLTIFVQECLPRHTFKTAHKALGPFSKALIRIVSMNELGARERVLGFDH
jgi:hypothetical protein